MPIGPDVLAADDLKLTDPAFFANGDPYEAWRRLRREDPVRQARTAYGRPYWSLTRHAEVRAVLQDSHLFSSRRSGATLPLDADMADPAKSPSLRLAMEGAMLPMTDPPRHQAMRQALHGRFLPRAVDAMEGFITRLASGLIAELIDLGEADFVADLAARLPTAVIFEMMQVPRQDWPHLFAMANMAGAPADPDYLRTSPAESRAHAFQEITAYVIALAKARRADPGDDLVSLLATVTVNGVALTDDEIGYNGFMFVLAGQETTRNSLSAGMAELIGDPVQMDRLRHDPDLLRTLPDEFVRWASPIAHVMRTATADTELGGRAIAEGDWVVAWQASANRDEAAFADPDSFDISRTPNPHVGFGGGDHFCLGARLARLQLRAIIQAFLDQVESIELAGEIERVASHQVIGLKRMPVRVRARA